MPKTYCPSCDAVVSVDKPHMGAIISCRECGTELEVISVNPFELDFPFDEDWEDELEWEEEEEED